METRSEEQNRNWSWGEKNAEADDISYQIPSWKAIRRWLHSGALTRPLLKTSSEEVVTYAFDDTKKVARVRLRNVKLTR